MDCYCSSLRSPAPGYCSRLPRFRRFDMQNVLKNAGRGLAALFGIGHGTRAVSEQGLALLSLWRQCMAPDIATPPNHQDCEEVVLVTEGSGELHLGGKAEPFGPDTSLVLTPNRPHQI